jgi:hypothetical protein
MNEVALNLWDGKLYGTGYRNYTLTAYPLHENGAVNSSVYVSVRVSRKDLPKRYVVDDDWFYPGSRSYAKYLQLFVSKQLERKIK